MSRIYQTNKPKPGYQPIDNFESVEIPVDMKSAISLE